MFDDISYKTDIDSVKSKIRENYMKAAYNFVCSGEYSLKRKKRLFNVFLFSFFYIFIDAILLYVLIKSFDEYSEPPVLMFFLIMTIFLPFFLYFIYYFQNKSFGREIKTVFSKYVMKDIADFEYISDGETELSKTGLLSEDDIKDAEITDYYTSSYIDDTFCCNRKNTKYSFKEINLIKGSGKSSTTVFKGMILKADLNRNLKGKIAVKTIETCKTTDKTRDIYIATLIFGIFVFDIFFLIITEYMKDYNDYYPWTLFSVLIFSFILCFIIAKLIYNYRNKKTEFLINKLRTDSDFININDNLIVKATNSAIAESGAIYELCEIIENLRVLFEIKEIYCKIKDKKAILALKSKENLFEQGSLFKSPMNERIAERLVAQFTGIFLFTDFIATVFNNKNQ